jgi:DNA-binding transcriptional LysR family regulator
MERSFPSIEIRRFHYYSVVAEEAGFARAVNRARRTQPALSVQIRQLDRHVGAELFVRGRRQIIRGAAGAALCGDVAVGVVTRGVAAVYVASIDSAAMLTVIAGHTVDLVLAHLIDQLRRPGRYLRLELSGDSRDGQRT